MIARDGPALKRDLADYAHQLHARGYVANHDGNLSVRLPDGQRFMATATALSKRVIEPHHILTVGRDGRVLSGRYRVFSEWHLHAACYDARDDVRCVIHAHPIHATALGLAGVQLCTPAMPEVVVSLGANIPLLDYAMPKSPDQDQALIRALDEADAICLAGNGVIVVGGDLETTFLRLELLEHYANIFAAALPFGGVRPLPRADVDALLKKRTAAGLGKLGR